MVAQLIENYYYLGDAEAARDLAARMADQLLDTSAFFLEWGSLGQSEFESASRILLYIADLCKQYGDKDLSKAMTSTLEALLRAATGEAFALEDEPDSLEID